MKVLIVARSDEIKNMLAYHFQPIGFEIDQYNDPVKVINNIDELNPEMILYHIGDFPRHWKPLLKLLREKNKRRNGICAA